MYNRKLAVEYAMEWALKRNPKYARFDNMGGDCTNFVSQCLYAGGIKYNYNGFGWFYHSLNSRSYSWAGVDELFSFAIKNKHENGPKFYLTNLNNVEIGDVIQLKINQIWSHTIIVTQVKNPKNASTIFVCSHDIDAKNIPLSTYNYEEIRFCKVI